MPPSGYSTDQADYLGSFLRSCAKALEREAMEFHQDYGARLTKEIEDITGYLLAVAEDGGQRPVLELTRHFYSMVRELNPTTADQFWRGVDDTIGLLKGSILAIHIGPEIQLKKSA